jgi:photosystem II stability/assembly factor-like uncharacterized protein
MQKSFFPICAVFFLFTSLSSGNQWEAVGPYGGMGSRILSLAQDCQNPLCLYSGSDGEGVFKSTDGGVHWMSVNSGLNYQAIITMAVDPSLCSTVYAGSQSGKMYTSHNSGEEWVEISTHLPAIPLRDIAISPLDGDILYIALGKHPVEGGGGIYKTVNGGLTWLDMSGSIENRNIFAIEVDPNDPAVIYAGAVGHYNPNTQGALYRSTNAGSTWTTIQILTPNHLYAPVQEITIDRTDSDIVFVGTSGEGVYKSTDGGGSWIRAECEHWSFHMSEINSIVIDPYDTDIIYLGGGAPSTFEPCIYKSVDAGLTWFRSDQGLDWLSVLDLIIDVNDSNLLFAGTDAGFYHSSSDGDLWESSNDGLSMLHVYSMAICPYDPNIWMAGTNQGVFSTVDRGESWQQGIAVNAVITSLAFHPTSSAVFALVGGGSWSDGVYVSDDYGSSFAWQLITYLPRPTSLAINPDDPSILFVAHEEGILKTLDGGLHWSENSSGITEFPVEEIVVVTEATNSAYAITPTKVWKSVDGGLHWSELSGPFGLEDYNPNTISVHPQRSSEIYIGTWGGIIKSTDGGESWQRIDLEGYDIQSIVVDISNPRILYAGSNGYGVLRSEDEGQTWKEMNANLKNKRITALSIELSRSSFMLAGSNGSSVFLYNLELNCDVNGDGSVNVLDVVTTIRHILGRGILSGDALLRADCNGDGQIDILDVLGIVSVITGSETMRVNP